MAAIVVVFDFDRTLIDGDSDSWVVTEMGLSDLFHQLRSTLPWNSLMDRMMKELHSRGETTDDIAECLKKTPVHPRIAAAIKAAHAFGCDLRILSDANQFFIEKILEHHDLLGCFSKIYTNPTFVDEEGRLRIFPYHDSTLSPHGCSLCPSNLCKGQVLNNVQASAPESERQNFIYLGDGSVTELLSKQKFVNGATVKSLKESCSTSLTEYPQNEASCNIFSQLNSSNCKLHISVSSPKALNHGGAYIASILTITPYEIRILVSSLRLKILWRLYSSQLILVSFHIGSMFGNHLPGLSRLSLFLNSNNVV
ncbi:hypothetical protein CXB51_013361 [Gossypium anomalum]|uniref:Uncharacterized protein n=1 Tax=Gossypium anomalum TaxID=47600 RepID=A0A8J6D901_9ROSI|nr:hypothetical protein CXB51_013361 [Gossypium anomalum]